MKILFTFFVKLLWNCVKSAIQLNLSSFHYYLANMEASAAPETWGVNVKPQGGSIYIWYEHPWTFNLRISKWFLTSSAVLNTLYITRSFVAWIWLCVCLCMFACSVTFCPLIPWQSHPDFPLQTQPWEENTSNTTPWQHEHIYNNIKEGFAYLLNEKKIRPPKWGEGVNIDKKILVLCGFVASYH